MQTYETQLKAIEGDDDDAGGGDDQMALGITRSNTVIIRCYYTITLLWGGFCKMSKMAGTPIKIILYLCI